MIIIAKMILLAVLLISANKGTNNADSSESADVSDEYARTIVGSKHDFSEATGRWGSACDACHIPHIQAIRPTTQPTTQPAFEIYRIKGQRRVFEPDRYMPGPTSLICLGCHDGTVATSTIGSSHALLAGLREGFAAPDSFVWRDHPIGVPYPRNNREYQPLAFVLAKGRVRLPEGRIECISCHDPHSEAKIDPMLVMSNKRSALCLSCHVK
ncbi:MAG: hypothetical protein JSV03_10615 [Planctomycetota bacterium]|nr:MAG: hypothetical protein JSV03_10615 [Planctomycetota bacterium]